MKYFRTRCALLGCLTLGFIAACSDDDSNGKNSDVSSGGKGTGGTSATDDGGAGGFGVNSNDTTAAQENPCSKSTGVYADRDADELFGAEKIPTFDLYLSDESWKWLNAHATEEQYVEAQACFNGEAIGVVGLRYKGSYGSLYSCFNDAGENTCRKVGMKIKFDEYTEKQRFFGLKRLNFQGYHWDGSYLKERLSLDLYREMGIVTPRAAWAQLRINGEMQGLFGMVEQIDGRFAKDRWPDNGDANLFKEVWPGRTDEKSAKGQLETNEEVADVSAMLAFNDALNGAADDELRETLGKFIDLKYLARFMAVDDAVASFDGVTTFYSGDDSTDGAGNHNFFFYQENENQFTIIPWDLESSLSLQSGFGNVPYWQTTPADCSKTYAVWSGQNQVMAPGCDRVFRGLAADLTDYKAAAQELLDGPFSTERMNEKIDTLASFIRAAATVDPKGPGATEFENGVGYLKQEIPRLRARLQRFMSGEPTVPAELDVSKMNGFETEDDYGLTVGTILLANGNSTTSVEINDDDPIEGTQSIRFLFNFRNETTPWNQWAFYSIPFVSTPADLSTLTGIRVTLRSNAARELRFDLKSPNNTKASEGVQAGWDLAVTTKPKVYEVLFANAKVPSWATDPGDNLQSILKTVTGLSFQAGCIGRDATGQLPDGVTDNGWIDIDSVEFF